MKTILFLILFCLMTVPVSAETVKPDVDQNLVFEKPSAEDMSNQLQAFWDQNIDTTTEWGQWLAATYKPYIEDMQKAANSNLPSLTEELSGDEIKKKVDEMLRASQKAFQGITPPPEFEVYHAKMLELLAETTKGLPPEENAELINKLTAEMNQELGQLFLRHGVPQKIIDMFIVQP